MKCDYLLPWGEVGIVNHDEALPECLLPKGHAGDHLVKTENGYFVWGPIENCDCEPDDDDLDPCCFAHGEVTTAEAEKMLWDQVRTLDKLLLFKVIGSRIPLRPSTRRLQGRAGKRALVGPCPDKQCNSPDAFVVSEKGFYHCFGCGKHGDLIRYLVLLRGWKFKSALNFCIEHSDLGKPLPRLTKTFLQKYCSGRAR